MVPEQTSRVAFNKTIDSIITKEIGEVEFKNFAKWQRQYTLKEYLELERRKSF